jgi:hypothetical protein
MPKILPDTDTFIIAAAVGLVLGSFLSYVFGSLALPSKIPDEFTIGGFSSNLIIVNILVTVLVSAIIFLGYVAAIVRDTVFPTKHPWLFLTETAVVSFVPASVIYLMTDVRTNGALDFNELNANFLLLAAKFGIFHLLFQFSGVYSYFFST